VYFEHRISLVILAVLVSISGCEPSPTAPTPDDTCAPVLRADTLPIRAGETGLPQLTLANECDPAWLDAVSWNATLDGESINTVITEAIAAGHETVDGDRLELTLNSLELNPGRTYDLQAEVVDADGRRAAATARLGADWNEAPIVLGEFFGEVVAGRMLPPGLPRPGGKLRVLVGGNAVSRLDEELSVRLAPVGPGIPAERFLQIEADWEAFDTTLATILRAIVFRLPDAKAGFYWLSVSIGTQSFPWRQIEIAPADETADTRAARFAVFEELLDGNGEAEEDFILRAPFGPTAGSHLIYTFPDAEPLTIPGGSRVQYALRATDPDADPSQLQPPMYVYYEPPSNNGTAPKTLTPVFATADQFLQYAPGQIPRFERGWLWDRRVSGGTCGTAQCRFGYPFPGNTGTYIGDPSTLVIATPPPPDPFQWWRNRPTAGGICGTGYCNPPFPLGDWPKRPPPIDAGPLVAGGADDSDDDDDTDEDEGTTERPPVTTTPRPTPVAPPPAQTCTAQFVEAVAGFDYDRKRRGKGTRVRPYNPITQEPAIYTNLPERRATLWYSVMPKDWDATNGSTPAWPAARVRFETEAARAWYDQYCIRLTFRRVTLRPDDESRLGRANAQLAARLPPNLRASIVGQNLADSRALLSASVYAHHFASRARDARDVSILFMDQAVGDVGKRAASARPSQGSFNILYFNGIALHSKDADGDRQYILTHELTHAYGRIHKGKKWKRRKPVSYKDFMSIGPHSWYHDSAAPKAMSRVTREHVADPLGLDGSKLYDYAEYVDALESNLLRR
jgi:hypothetical protein